MRRADVLVVGAGLAGLWTARLLAQAGLSVVLVDDRAGVDRRLRTTGIFVRRTLEDFPLPTECFGPEIRRVVLYSPSYRSLILESQHPEFRVARMEALSLWLLGEAREAGVEWRPRTSCLGLAETGGESIARLSGAHGGPLRSRFVIGADGARSRVAGWLGLPPNREWIVGVEEVYTGIPCDGPPAFHCVLSSRLAPGYLAWLVHDGEAVHLGVAGYPERFDPNAALAAFRERPPVPLAWGEARLVDRRGGRIPVGGVLPRIATSRGLLVGDAAGAVSPLTAGGIDPCLRLSELAAKVALEYLTTGDEARLDPYDGERFRRRFRTRLALRALLSRLDHPALLEAACAGLRLLPFRSLARGVFFGRGSFPDVDRFPAGVAVARACEPALRPRSTA
jgi:flavin-dependent dehydrogenase